MHLWWRQRHCPKHSGCLTGTWPGFWGLNWCQCHCNLRRSYDILATMQPQQEAIAAAAKGAPQKHPGAWPSQSARVSSSSLAPQISTYLRALSHCNQTRRRSQAGSTAQVLERRHRLHRPRQVAFHSRVARSGWGIRGCCGFRLPKVGCPGLAPIRRAFRRATRPRAKRPPAAHTAHCAAHCAACCAAVCGAQSQGPIFRNFTNRINLTNQTLIGPNVLSVLKS